jgi:hypothetical protein
VQFGSIGIAGPSRSRTILPAAKAPGIVYLSEFIHLGDTRTRPSSSCGARTAPDLDSRGSASLAR